MANQEVELKLLAEPTDLARLRRQAWLKPLRRGRALTRRLDSVYFDTPGHALLAAGVALRVRSVGRRRIQAVKTTGTPIGGAFARGEWECEIDGDRPDPRALAETPLAPLFDADTVAALAPAVETRISRTALRLASGGAEIELAFDEGEILAGSKRLPLSEIELELASGPRRALFDLALRLHAAAPLRVGRASKAEKGFRLLLDRAPEPARWTGSTVRHGMSGAEAFQAVARGCVDHLAANEDCLLATGHPEAVHQMRVAIRRLRSALSAFREFLATAETAAVQDELRWLLQQLGPARDSDVFLDEILDGVDEPLRSDPAVAALRARFVGRRDEHYRDAVAALTSPRFTAAVLSLGGWIEGGDWLDGGPALHEPVEAIAGRLLSACDAKIGNRRKLAAMTPEKRHRLRIRVKKMRYVAEFFAPLYAEKKARRTLAALSELQDRLGRLNDIAVGRATLATHLPAGDAALHWAAGLVAGWHAARTRRLLAKADKRLAAYRALPRFWEA